MKKIFLFSIPFIFTILFITISCQNHSHPGEEKAIIPEQTRFLDSELSDSSISLDLEALMEVDSMPDEVKVDIKYDHFFKTAKSYRAYSLNELIEPYLLKLQIPATTESEAVITFFCTDGYKPTLQVSELLAAEGYLVFCDEGFSDGEPCWPDSLKSKFPPFYLVWKDVPYENQRFPWPYGLVKIKIDKTNTVYDAIYPFNNEEAITGFNQFRFHCIKCHSINKIGGNVGPDFNYPKNITEYWEVENMWNYAKNPQSFRYNARMSPITSLTRQEFDDIIVYLQHIRSDK